MRKARQFADPEAGYTKEDLEELFGQLRKHRPVFGSSFVGLLVTLSRGQRKSFQRRCIKEGWSKSRLESELKLLRPNQRQGGRRRRVLNERQAIVDLEEKCETWRRWLVEVRLEPAGGAKKKCVFDRLPAEVRERLETAEVAIQELATAVGTSLVKVRQS